MKNSPDPSWYREREDAFIAHVERLLGDERLRLDTTLGRRPAIAMLPVSGGDKAVDLKRAMVEAGKPDRELESHMPTGRFLEVGLARKRLWFLKVPVGRLRALCVSPVRAILLRHQARAADPQRRDKDLSETPPAIGGVPSTLVILSTAGFTIEAREAAERRAERTVVLVEPNNAGGWTVYGPPQTKSRTDLFDPEAEEEKRQRIRGTDRSGGSISRGGIAVDKIVARTALPLQLVEAELKSYAKENPGLAAKRLDGRLVLFQDGAARPAARSGRYRYAVHGTLQSPVLPQGRN